MSRSSGSADARSHSSKSSDTSIREYVDLALKSSLTKESAVQREEFKRVPSIGGTSHLDLTVNEDEFFGNGRCSCIFSSSGNKGF